MPDRTILDEAAAALLMADRVDGRSCPDRLLDIFRPDCADCQREAREVAAVMLRAVEKRLRAMLANYPEDVFPPDGTTRDAISARAMRHAYTVGADMLAEGLPDTAASDAAHTRKDTDHA
jgi:hypothetical protein